MAETNIEWADKVWNPIIGCTYASPGCTNCYAVDQAWIRSHHPNPRISGKFAGTVAKTEKGKRHWTGQINFDEAALLAPLRWKKPQRIFVNSMSDLFHEGVTDEQRDRIFAVMALCPQHQFQVLTKRADRMREYMTGRFTRRVARVIIDWLIDGTIKHDKNWPVYTVGNLDDPEDIIIPRTLPNVWLGVSVENQQTADERIPHLLATPAAVRWISAEPLLGPVDLSEWLICPNARDGLSMDPSTGAYECCRNCDWTGLLGGLDWVVTGGETGPNSRPTHPDNIRSLRDQCAAGGVPFNLKQWGDWWPLDQAEREWDLPRGAARDLFTCRTTEDHAKIGKKRAGRLLDGVLHDAYPLNHGEAHP